MLNDKGAVHTASSVGALLMGRFDEFEDDKDENKDVPRKLGGRLLPSLRNIVGRASERPSREVTANKGLPSAPGSQRISDRLDAAPARGAFAIALDATGSMAPLIDTARDALGEIMRRVSREAARPIRLRLYVYRDYDAPVQQLLEHTDLTGDVPQLEDWLQQRKANYGGGNDGEAVEVALADIAKRDEVDAVLLAGDEPSNSRDHMSAYGHTQSSTAHDWARRLKERSTPIHAFVVGHRPSTLVDFPTIAQLSGGCHGRLDGGADMIDMAVLAMLKSLAGEAAARRYAEGHALTDNAREFAALLLPPPRE